MTAISSVNLANPLLSDMQSLHDSAAAPSANNLEVREAFQDFVAGTFYKQLFKSLRSTQQKSAYLHGGPAEDIFQSQMDQQVAEDLARTHGAGFSETLFEASGLARR
jgi:peptidoglycan hydrolase FlgJ